MDNKFIVEEIPVPRLKEFEDIKTEKEWPHNKGYRENPNDFIMPLVQRVAAQTVGMELVSVQPMSAPTGMLAYLDYSYDKKPWWKKIINWIKRKYENIRRRTR